MEVKLFVQLPVVVSEEVEDGEFVGREAGYETVVVFVVGVAPLNLRKRPTMLLSPYIAVSFASDLRFIDDAFYAKILQKEIMSSKKIRFACHYRTSIPRSMKQWAPIL